MNDESLGIDPESGVLRYLLIAQLARETGQAEATIISKLCHIRKGRAQADVLPQSVVLGGHHVFPLCHVRAWSLSQLGVTASAANDSQAPKGKPSRGRPLKKIATG